MAALQCEICGGKLIAKAGGLFECDSCGMQYDKTRIQEMVQQIKGTVKVEGTVQVTGSVKVEGVDSKESRLRRAYFWLRDGQWESAFREFSIIAAQNPECSEAYSGIVYAQTQCSTAEELIAYSEQNLEDTKYYRDAMRYGNAAIKETLLAWKKQYNALQDVLQEKAAQKATQEQQQRDKIIPLLEARRSQTMLARNMLEWVAGGFAILTPDGCLARPMGSNFTSREKNLQQVNNIQAVVSARIQGHVLVLDFDGNTGILPKESYKYSEWFYDEIKPLTTDGQAVGIGFTASHIGDPMVYKKDGTVTVWKNTSSVGVTYAENKTYRLSEKVTQKLRNLGPVVQYKTNADDDVIGVSDTLTLRTDGAVRNKQENVIMDNIVMLSGNYGLCLDGTVITALNPGDRNYVDVSGWHNIAAVLDSGYTLYGITEDGYLISGNPKDGKRVEDRFFTSLEELRQKREYHLSAEAAKKRARCRQLIEEQNALQKEERNLTGIFTGKRRREIQARLAEIETELKGLR